MKFGLFYVLESPDGDFERAYKEMFEQIAYGEELGFESVWLAEHHGSAYGSIPSGAVAAAAIARITTRMRIGMAVSILPFNNAVRVAEDYAMVDVISGGRLDMGVGRGYQPREFAHLGISDRQEHSREIFEESLDVLIGLWENERFSYRGKYYQLEDVELTPRPVQKPRPPITVAAISPSTFELVGKYGLDIMVTPTLMSLDELKGFVLDARRRLVEAGRDPSTINFPMNWQMHLAESEALSLSRSADALKWYFDLVMQLVPKKQAGYEYMASVAAEFEKAGGVNVQDLRDNGIIILGDPDEARRRLREVRDEIDQQQVFCWMRIGGLEDAKVRDSMRLFAQEVMPEFRTENTSTTGGGSDHERRRG